jgi:hypothetical protein
LKIAVPALQWLVAHEFWPSYGWNVPYGQALHCSAFTLSWYVFALHFVHVPSAVWYVPGVHEKSLHASEPLSHVYFPAAQVLHLFWLRSSCQRPLGHSTQMLPFW